MKKIIFLIMLFLPVIVSANSDLAKTSKSAIMIEASTGEVIFEKDANKKLPPASMTKIMTMLLTVEAIEKDIIKWNDTVTVSEKASSMGGSQILLETGEKMKVEDLFKGVAIASGNDAAVALAEKIAGSVSLFVDMMNKRAKELGLTKTNFKNPHGLDDPNHYSCAKDMSIMAKELVKHEKVLEFTKTYDTYLRVGQPTKIWLVNTNKLVKFYSGLDGLKTGYTKEAGYCLTSTAKRDGMRLITVIMGSEDTDIRNKETTELLDYGFAQYEVDTYASVNTNLGNIKIKNGEDKVSILNPKQDITFLKKKTEEKKKNIKHKIEVNKMKAPIKKGDKVGVLKILENNKVVQTIDLTINKDNKKINIINLYFRNLLEILQP